VVAQELGQVAAQGGRGGLVGRAQVAQQHGGALGLAMLEGGFFF
jgi:hypothetical protein